MLVTKALNRLNIWILVFYLVAYGLGAAPLKKDLFDAAGAGHPKTLRPLQFGFRVHWFGATVRRRGGKDTWESFSVKETCIHHNSHAPWMQHLPVTGFRVQSFKDRPTSLSANVTWQSLWPHQLPPPLSYLPEGPVTAYVTVSAGREHRRVRQCKTYFTYPKRCRESPFTHLSWCGSPE